MDNVIILDPFSKPAASDTDTMLKIHRALISVSDKKGIVEFAKALKEFSVEIISTGGTYTTLKNAGIEVKSVSDITGFPEILDGRVKTLHPSIHGGILAVLDNPSHIEQLKKHNIEPIDLVVVNLYPFEQTIAAENVKLDEAIEQIDIGGPAMVRSSSKNFRHTAIIVNPDLYGVVLEEMHEHDGALTIQTRFNLACRAFQHTAHYDSVIASYLSGLAPQNTLPDSITISLRKEQPMRYGENPHQSAALYGKFSEHFQKLHGKELSYNNIADADSAWECVKSFTGNAGGAAACVIIKHANPCGVAVGANALEAYEKAFKTDPSSAFGGIIALNIP